MILNLPDDEQKDYMQEYDNLHFTAAGYLKGTRIVVDAEAIIHYCIQKKNIAQTISRLGSAINARQAQATRNEKIRHEGYFAALNDLEAELKLTNNVVPERYITHEEIVNL